MYPPDLHLPTQVDCDAYLSESSKSIRKCASASIALTVDTTPKLILAMWEVIPVHGHTCTLNVTCMVNIRLKASWILLVLLVTFLLHDFQLYACFIYFLDASKIVYNACVYTIISTGPQTMHLLVLLNMLFS